MKLVWALIAAIAAFAAVLDAAKMGSSAAVRSRVTAIVGRNIGPSVTANSNYLAQSQNQQPVVRAHLFVVLFGSPCIALLVLRPSPFVLFGSADSPRAQMQRHFTQGENNLKNDVFKEQREKQMLQMQEQAAKQRKVLAFNLHLEGMQLAHSHRLQKGNEQLQKEGLRATEEQQFKQRDSARLEEQTRGSYDSEASEHQNKMAEESAQKARDLNEIKQRDDMIHKEFEEGINKQTNEASFKSEWKQSYESMRSARKALKQRNKQDDKEEQKTKRKMVKDYDEAVKIVKKSVKQTDKSHDNFHDAVNGDDSYNDQNFLNDLPPEGTCWLYEHDLGQGERWDITSDTPDFTRTSGSLCVRLCLCSFCAASDLSFFFFLSFFRRRPERQDLVDGVRS